jgi:hypothetical protein
MAQWTERVATRFKEGLNSLFSVVKCEVCRSSPVEHMSARLFFVAEKLTRLCYYSSENSG